MSQRSRQGGPGGKRPESFHRAETYFDEGGQEDAREPRSPEPDEASEEGREQGGTLLADRFEIGGLLGEGGMARVFEAVDHAFDRKVAVKFLRSDVAAAAPEARSRFFDEARVLAGIEHPGAIPVYDAGIGADREPYYAMKRIQGRTLADRLEGRGRAEIADRSHLLGLVTLFARACETVAAAHEQGIVHRDLKPQNMMIDHFGAVYVVDWGLAKRLPREGSSSGSRTVLGALMGTPQYMAPEQADGRADLLDRRADVFSLGAILYEILTGVRPFDSGSLEGDLERVRSHEPPPARRLNRVAGRALSAICAKALAKRPEDRYRDAGALAADLRNVLEDRPIEAGRQRLSERIARWARRRPALAATLATTSLVVLLGFAVASSWYRTERALLADAFDRIEESQADSDRMAADLADIRGRIAAAPDAPARLELVERAEELEELLSVERELRAGLVNAALGFSIGSDDDRARALARKRLFDDLDGALAVGNFVRIEVLAERFVASSGGMNPLRLSDAEVARLRSLLELAREKNLERRREAVAGATDPVPAPPTDALP